MDTQGEHISVEKKSPWWLNLWIWWIALTILYVGLQFFLFAVGDSGSPKLDWPVKITNSIGLFVPVGTFTFFELLGVGFSNYDCSETICTPYYVKLLAIPILFGGLFFAQRLARKFPVLQENRLKKIIYNLVILLIITALVDVVIWGGWLSFQFLYVPFSRSLNL